MERTRKAAKFAKAAYMIGDGLTRKNIYKVNAYIADTGYVVEPDMSMEDITTFYNAKSNKYHISHKGTHLGSSTGAKDLRADTAFALFGYNTPHVKERLKNTEEIIDMINMRDPSAPVSMSSHSLGGHTSSFTMAQSDLVLKRVDALDTFDTAAHPAYMAGLNVPFHKQRILDDKVVHHRMTGDLVSKSMLYRPDGMPFGQTKSYKLANAYKGRPISRAFDAHSLDHFIEGGLLDKKKSGANELEDLKQKTAQYREAEKYQEIAKATEKYEADVAGGQARPTPISLHNTVADVGGSVYINPYALCRQFPQLPECKAFQ